MNPFERHGIKHLSPSSLRLYREDPAVWCLQYLLRIKDDGSPAMWRGTAVEAGLNHYLLGQPDYALKAMHVSFEERAAGLADDKTAKEREALPMFLAQAREATKDKATGGRQQYKLQVELPGIEVPIQGIADYLWPDHGIDLKTTWRMPSEPDPAHVEQMSVYMMATGVTFDLVYVTPKKWSSHEVTKDMAAEAYERVIRGARAIRSFLSRVDSPQDALSMFAPDTTGFRWSPQLIEAYRSAA